MEVPSNESINLHILGLLIAQFRYRPLYQLSQAVKAPKKIVIPQHRSDMHEISIFTDYRQTKKVCRTHPRLTTYKLRFLHHGNLIGVQNPLQQIQYETKPPLIWDYLHYSKRGQGFAVGDYFAKCL